MVLTSAVHSYRYVIKLVLGNMFNFHIVFTSASAIGDTQYYRVGGSLLFLYSFNYLLRIIIMEIENVYLSFCEQRWSVC